MPERVQKFVDWLENFDLESIRRTVFMSHTLVILMTKVCIENFTLTSSFPITISSLEVQIIEEDGRHNKHGGDHRSDHLLDHFLDHLLTKET